MDAKRMGEHPEIYEAYVSGYKDGFIQGFEKGLERGVSIDATVSDALRQRRIPLEPWDKREPTKYTVKNRGKKHGQTQETKDTQGC